MSKLTSHKPSKQRKLLFNIPLHKRGSTLTVPLIGSLSERTNLKRISVRKNDEVTVIKGDYKGVKGNVTRVDRKGGRIFVEGITREKSDGTVLPISVSPHSVIISKLDTSDKRRRLKGGE